MKSLLVLKDMEHVQGGIVYPQSVEVRSVSTIRALGTDGETTICTVTLEDEVPVVRVKLGIKVGTIVPVKPDEITMPRSQAEAIAEVLEDARNALHVHASGSDRIPSTTLSREHADTLRRRIDRALHG